MPEQTTTEHQAPAQPYPWQLLYNERFALAGDLANLEQRIGALRYEADQLEPVRDAMSKRLDALQEATDQYEAWGRAQAAADA